jgi:hypothetical protein
MPAAQIDMPAMEKGESYTHRFTYELEDDDYPGVYVAVDVSIYDAELVVTDQPGSGTTLLTLTSGASQILLNADPGAVDVVLTPAETAAVTWDIGFYKIRLTQGSTFSKRLAEGIWPVKE